MVKGGYGSASSKENQLHAPGRIYLYATGAFAAPGRVCITGA
jgi:hypothetical protein